MQLDVQNSIWLRTFLPRKLRFQIPWRFNRNENNWLMKYTKLKLEVTTVKQSCGDETPMSEMLLQPQQKSNKIFYYCIKHLRSSIIVRGISLTAEIYLNWSWKIKIFSRCKSFLLVVWFIFTICLTYGFYM